MECNHNLQPLASFRLGTHPHAPRPSARDPPPPPTTNSSQKIPRLFHRLHLPHFRHISCLPLHRPRIPPPRSSGRSRSYPPILRLHYLAPLALPPRLFHLRTTYPSSPSSLEAVMQVANALLLQHHPWPSFILPPRLARMKPKNIERTYGPCAPWSRPSAPASPPILLSNFLSKVSCGPVPTLTIALLFPAPGFDDGSSRTHGVSING
jgi:hypothetical protein